MGFDKGLHLVAHKEGRSSLAFESSGFVIAAPSTTYIERRLVKYTEWTNEMLYPDMAEECLRRLLALVSDSSSHYDSIIRGVGKMYGRESRTVQVALEKTGTTLSSSAAK